MVGEIAHNCDLNRRPGFSLPECLDELVTVRLFSLALGLVEFMFVTLAALSVTPPVEPDTLRILTEEVFSIALAAFATAPGVVAVLENNNLRKGKKHVCI